MMASPKGKPMAHPIKLNRDSVSKKITPEIKIPTPIKARPMPQSVQKTFLSSCLTFA